jgi:hypothetical protein
MVPDRSKQSRDMTYHVTETRTFCLRLRASLQASNNIDQEVLDRRIMANVPTTHHTPKLGNCLAGTNIGDRRQQRRPLARTFHLVVRGGAPLNSNVATWAPPKSHPSPGQSEHSNAVVGDNRGQKCPSAFPAGTPRTYQSCPQNLPSRHRW